MPVLLLVDGTAVAYRAFHAIRGLSTKDGRPTNAVYGLIHSVRRWIDMLDATHAAVVFDRGMPQYRVDVLESYKAQRPEMPEDLASQIPVMIELLEAWGIPVVIQEGVEADDVLARLALDGVRAGYDTIVVTSDKDMLSLLDRGVRLVLPHRPDETVDAGWVKEKYGVPPDRMPDLLALTGDSVDNIPGVPGVGPKTAAGLLREFGSAEGVLEGVDRISSPRIRKAVAAAADDVRRNLDLIRLRPEEARPVAPDSLRLRRPDRAKLAPLLRDLEFHGFLRELEEGSQGTLF